MVFERNFSSLLLLSFYDRGDESGWYCNRYADE